MGGKVSPSPVRQLRAHHYSSDEEVESFHSNFNEGTMNLPMLISCQTKYSNTTGFVLLIARISCVTDSQRTHIAGSVPPLLSDAEQPSLLLTAWSSHRLQRMHSHPQTARHGTGPHRPSEVKLLLEKN